MGKHNVLVVWMPNGQASDERSYRDYILESLQTGVLVLPSEVSCEVMELPTLGGVAVLPETPEKEAPAEGAQPEQAGTVITAEEKRLIVQRLKEYRTAQGLGSLEALAAKTAHQKGKRISAETLRYICGDGAPKMPLEDWQKIARALDTLEQRGS